MTDNINSKKKKNFITKDEKKELKTRIATYSAEHYGNMFGLIKIDVRFHGYYCYIESYHEPHGTVRTCSQKSRAEAEDIKEKLKKTPCPLCRLRYVARNQWTLCLYNFCKDLYESSFFLTGLTEGTPEEGLDTAMEYFYGTL